MIGFVIQKTKNREKKSKNFQVLALSDSLDEDPFPGITSEINIIDSYTGKGKSSGNKKKGKRKTKQSNCSKEKSTKNEPFDKKRKPRYPFSICEEDHYTKECPHRAEFSRFIKSLPTPIILKDNFPQDSKMVSHNQSSSSLSAYIMMMSSIVMVAMRSKDYTSKSPVEN